MAIQKLVSVPTEYEVMEKVDQLVDQSNKNETEIANRIPSSQKGAANGVATLDGNSKVTATQASADVISVSSSRNLLHSDNKSKTTAEQQKEINAWVKIAVAAAEQIYVGSGRGEEKKAYVIDWLRSHGITVDEEKLDALIEAAVYELNQGVIPIEGIAVKEGADNEQ